MSRHYLLDTNIISRAARDPRGRLASRMLETGEERLFTSVIVLAEIRYGLARNPEARARAQIEELVAALDVRDLPYAAAQHYGRVRHALERQGRPIGGNDYWIAAHALSDDAILVSNNVREFARVPGLSLVDWVGNAS